MPAAGWKGETYSARASAEISVLSWTPRIFYAKGLLTPGLPQMQRPQVTLERPQDVHERDGTQGWMSAPIVHCLWRKRRSTVFHAAESLAPIALFAALRLLYHDDTAEWCDTHC